MARRERAGCPDSASMLEPFARREQALTTGPTSRTARKLVGMLWGLSAALSAAFLLMAPPNVALGDAGWPAAVLIVALSAAGARLGIRGRDGLRPAADDQLLGPLAQTAMLQWLARGAAPYRALFLLWLGSGVGVHNIRRGSFFIPVVVLFRVAAPPLQQGSPHRHRHGHRRDAVVAIGLALLFLIERVRMQRAAMMNIEAGDARERAEEAVKKVRGLEAVADSARRLSASARAAVRAARPRKPRARGRACRDPCCADDERDCLTLRAVPRGVESRQSGARAARQRHRRPGGAGAAAGVRP